VENSKNFDGSRENALSIERWIAAQNDGKNISFNLTFYTSTVGYFSGHLSLVLKAWLTGT